MNFTDEISRAINHIAYKDYSLSINDDEWKEKVLKTTQQALLDSTYNFSNFSSKILTQGKDKRAIKYYETGSPEDILCQCIKQILDRIFKIKYPNRNQVMRELFSYMSAISQMSHFTIIKFDFKDYYNSVSAPYVFERYMQTNFSNRSEFELVKKFVFSTQFAYAGLCTSNTICEIIAQHFDSTIKEHFITKGMIFYERYIDDCILLLNEHHSKNEINDFLDTALKKVFYCSENNNSCKCKTKFNNKKFQYISKDEITAKPVSINYLGYEFYLTKENSKIKILYGITESKKEKYTKKINRIISLFKDKNSPDYNNLELLRHRIAAFSSRTVYLNKYFNTVTWKVKGFISNYCELRYMLNDKFNLIEEKTLKFLKHMIADAFTNAGISSPYFLNSHGYNLYENMRNNKTLLLVDNIGYDYASLKKLCSQIGIDENDEYRKKKSYGCLVKSYLIKVKVGY